MLHYLSRIGTVATGKTMGTSQMNLDLLGDMTPSDCAMKASEVLAGEERHEGHGAVYTRQEVVEFILDLAGYTANRPLHGLRALEPSFGAGDFLIPMIQRLLRAWRRHCAETWMDREQLVDALRAVELHRATFSETKSAVVRLLCREGLCLADAIYLSDAWLEQGDFLFTEISTDFDFVIGNPPYVRHERIPDALLHEYRKRYTTMYGRADLYIPFFERGLELLTTSGRLFFICTDRWMKNNYGSALREYIAARYALSHYVDLSNLGAFETDVVAYPAIVGLSRTQNGSTRVACPNSLKKRELSQLSKMLSVENFTSKNKKQYVAMGVVNGRDPWLLDRPDEVALIRRIEAEYPTLEEVGCRVGIGVATGADDIFIADYDSLDVENDCKLPLLKTADIRTGVIDWQGLGVINPFLKSGELVSLETHPQLRRYLARYEDTIRSRYCAKKNPSQWYRTIDRIHVTLTSQRKLLIPDIANDAPVVYDSGHYYPHHNLYYIVSNSWNLRALQAVLLSDMTKLFISAYSTKMRGGFLRYQAQYLRRLRLPHWDTIAADVQEALISAGQEGCRKKSNKATSALYQLSSREYALFGNHAWT